MDVGTNNSSRLRSQQFDPWPLEMVSVTSELPRINDFIVQAVTSGACLPGHDVIMEDPPRVCEWLTRISHSGTPHPVPSASRNACSSSCKVLLLLGFNENWVCQPVSVKSLPQLSSCYMRTDKWTDGRTVAFTCERDNISTIRTTKPNYATKLKNWYFPRRCAG